MVARGFHAMRAGLVERGLIDSDGRVTPEGEAWTDEQLTKLLTAKPDCSPSKPRVRWRMGRAI